MSHSPQEITTLLVDWREGNEPAADHLVPIIYKELRRLAAHYIRHERPDHTLSATALVHEMYVRLCEGEQVDWQSRAHFFAIAAQQLRRILVDHARSRQADKRGGQYLKISLSDGCAGQHDQDEDILALHEALQRLQELEPRAAKVVELRFFGGLQEKEAAEVLGISVTTVKREWTFARAWLFTTLAATETAASVRHS